MDLIERGELLNLLQKKFTHVAEGEGHCVFISGEAGIGKTSLVKTFCKQQQVNCAVYQGACDSLFTPRLLAPLHDIIWQVHSDLWPVSHTIEERFELFLRFFHELSKKEEKVLIVFEDIHWADEATLDFIKFFGRRISQLRCLFILTYRDDEIHSRHPLRTVLGQLPPDSFSKLPIAPLSRAAVEKMAMEKGYSGEDVYSISGGNPFYVNEILSSYSLGVPDTIKDAVLSVYNRQEGKTREIWELISVIPGCLEIKHLEKMEPLYSTALEICLEAKILILSDGLIFFKHELFRRTIETSLSPVKRVALNKKILDMLQPTFEANGEIERIIHHAKNANAYDTVVRFVPVAAREAASVGAHIEASRLYLTAIEYYQGNDTEVLIPFYQAYAYECYLTNQIKEAIIYTGKSLNLWKKKNKLGEIGNCMRFLSRLWWFEGNHKQAENYGRQAIEVLNNELPSRSKAMAYGNMAHLRKLTNQTGECVSWGEQAMAIAREIKDDETLSYAMNSVGSSLMLIKSSMVEGAGMLHQSLEIALQNGYHEHVVRAHAALGSNAVSMKDYVQAKQNLETGIQYCEQKNLDSFELYMLSWKSRLNLETGNWSEAYSIAENLLKSENQTPVVKTRALVVKATIQMRRGDQEALSLLLEAKNLAFESKELQRIIPALSALLEYEWISGGRCIEKEVIGQVLQMVKETGEISIDDKLNFWLRNARNENFTFEDIHKGIGMEGGTIGFTEAALWEKLGCPYEQALSLFEGNDNDKRKALMIVHELGATVVYEKMKRQMRTSGIKRIPNGLRKTTLSNPAFLTARDLDVLQLLNQGMQNKEIANKLFISAKTVDHHISAILFKLDVNSRTKAVTEAVRQKIIK
jgi:ATP/maltotriose-dependent transcriptional regulator MalT